MNTLLNIEVELRSIFDESKYKELEEFLTKNAKDLGEDDKDVYFFILPDKLIKAVDNISKNTAKIVLKLNKIGEGSGFEEIEIPIQRESVEKAVKLFMSLGLNEIQRSFQKRHNYQYKEAEIALKYSETWGYHLELELLVESKDKVSEAEKKLHSLAEELGVKVMTDQELRDFTQKKDAEYRNKGK